MSKFFVILFFSLTASTLALKAATTGFSGSLVVLSALTSDRKAVFIVSGSCELLLGKPADSSGSNAQTVTTQLDHAVVVLYRTGQVFPSEHSWSDECQFVKKAIGRQVRFQTATGTYMWKDGDLTLIQTEHLQLAIAED